MTYAGHRENGQKFRTLGHLVRGGWELWACCGPAVVYCQQEKALLFLLPMLGDENWELAVGFSCFQDVGFGLSTPLESTQHDGTLSYFQKFVSS